MAYCALHKREFPDTDPCPYCKWEARASGARAPTVRDAIILIEKIEECDGMPAKLTLLRNFILFAAGKSRR